MPNSDDRRLIEDYLPIKAISAEASREKSVRKGHISTLHLWWARRPLVACRAAVYGALVPASRFVPQNGPEEKRASLGRANAAKFVERLSKYPGDPRVISEAQRHILEAHAERLSRETGKRITIEDIESGRAPRPKVLDMFAGGGSIPLEALRLGCETYALDLNPVAHIIELCTLVYPQKYGKPDPNTKGSAKDGTWAGLAEEVRYWGDWVLRRVKGEIGDLYPLIPDPAFKGKRSEANLKLFQHDGEIPAGYLTPVAYLWTRTVTCKNPACRAEVPLVRQTWLCKKDKRYVALKVIVPKGEKRVRFEVVEETSAKGLGFDPEAGSKGGNATCPFCGTVADSAHVKVEGCAGRMGQQLMAVVCTRAGVQGKVYLAADAVVDAAPDNDAIQGRIEALCKRTGLTVPNEPIINDAKSALFCTLYGLQTWGDLFTPRQMLCLLTFAAGVREAEGRMRARGYGAEPGKALATILAAIVDRLADFNSSLCIFNYTGGRGVKSTFGRQALPMVWDFAESNPFNPAGASWISGINDVPAGLRDAGMDVAGTVFRGSATSLPWPDRSFDAIVTDPPYYDNVPYADISDFFYVWLKRTVAHLYPEHFASEGTPKKAEAVADATRHGGSKEKARRAYEEMMAQAFEEAHRVLKLGGAMVVVYAHKTTLGWATLVDALRVAGFTVNEAWPLDTEKRGRLRAQESSALASSIFLVAGKRDGERRGRYEDEVRPELEAIVRERVNALWDQGVSGADLAIACVGAGLRAFTRFVRSEEFSEDIFALDLGPLADGNPQVPLVYRNPEQFFRTSYLTSGLRSLLQDVLSRLDGGAGSRVLKLVTPFGGGKSHTLAALFHAAKRRKALDAIPEGKGLPRPKKVRTAVFDGRFFDATNGKVIPGESFRARTMWGWIAWSLGGPEGYEILRAQDEARVAPGGDEILTLLADAPNLILLDETLNYLISAGGIKVEQTTLRDETLTFLQRLTVAVGNTSHTALVFSLQSSRRESLEYVNLLQTVDHLAARKDQRREPVEGDEILAVIQRRLLANVPDADEAAPAAAAYQEIVTQMRRAYAQSAVERQQAEEEGIALRDRVRAAYPFHPALIDLMRERWAAIPDFQRTRGALRFLAACLRASHREGKSRAVLGPGDVPIHDSEVRLAFFKEVGQREDFHACLEHDFIGSNARVRRIDERRAKENPAEALRRPATRLATAMLMYSFGGLRRERDTEGEVLPPGISEAELLSVCVGPDLDSTTALACLKELREQCLYLHYDGARYGFKKDPNVTLLLEQEADAVGRDERRVRERIKDMLEARLAGHREAIVWPEKPPDIADRDPSFLVAYLTLEFGGKPRAAQEAAATEFLEKHGDRSRQYRNGLGLAIPSSDQTEILRRAVRYLMAAEQVKGKARQLNLTKEQRDQLQEREATERSTAESAFPRLYTQVWLPRAESSGIGIEKVAAGGRPLQTTLNAKKQAMVHERVVELVTSVQPRVFGSLTPAKIVELFKLGEDQPPLLGIRTREVVDGFYSFFGFTRLISGAVIRKAIACGVQEGVFGYAAGSAPNLGADGKYQVALAKVRFAMAVSDDEIDLESGFLMMPQAIPQPAPAPEPQPPTPGPIGGPIVAPGPKSPGPVLPPPETPVETTVELAFTADQSQLYTAWNAIANLADLAGKVTITVRAQSAEGFDQSKLRNGVLEPLREADLIE